MCCCVNNSCLQKRFYLLVNDNNLSCIKVIYSRNHGLLWTVNKLNFDSLYRTEYAVVRSYGLPYRNKLFQSTSNIWYIKTRHDKTRQLYLTRVAQSAARLVSLGALGSIRLTRGWKRNNWISLIHYSIQYFLSYSLFLIQFCSIFIIPFQVRWVTLVTSTMQFDWSTLYSRLASLIQCVPKIA